MLEVVCPGRKVELVVGDVMSLVVRGECGRLIEITQYWTGTDRKRMNKE